MELLDYLKKRPGYSDIIEQVGEFFDQKQAPVFEPGKTAITASGKVVGALEAQAIVASALDGWLTTGRFNGRFEQRLTQILGAQGVLTCNSGSSANLISFSSLCSPKLGERAIKPGDEVLSVAAGFPTTINPIIQNGAVPVFVDVDPDTLNADFDLLEQAIGPKVKAIFLAHSLGNPADLELIKGLCNKHGLFFIEDTCDALGGEYDGQKVGTFGDLATISFYPAHHITMGEGGAVVVNNQSLAPIAESYRDWGRDCYCAPGKENTCGNRFCQQHGDLPFGYDHKYVYSHLGYNLKITDMQAACGLAQLESLDNFILRRKHNHRFLRERLDRFSEFFRFQEASPKADPSWFGFAMTLKSDCPFSRNDLIAYLNGLNIGTRLLFAGNVTKQPLMKGVNFRLGSSLEVTDQVMQNTFWIGVHAGLNDEMLSFVCDSISDFITKHAG